jgi:putative proteasome-type protease
MTYCLAIALERGLVFAADSRTNAGVDHVNTYCKLHRFCWPGERVFALLSAGNLATTQSVVRKLEHDARPDSGVELNMRTVSDVSAAAAYVGRVNVEIRNSYQDLQQGSELNLGATFILGGQVAGHSPELYMIYPEGNFIEASPEHPFIQIGETKYGKPILDRIIRPTTSLEDAARCALVSLDSTIRSNLSVGPPIQLVVYERDSLNLNGTIRFDADHPYLNALRHDWNEGLLRVFAALPPLDWAGLAAQQ